MTKKKAHSWMIPALDPTLRPVPSHVNGFSGPPRPIDRRKPKDHGFGPQPPFCW